MKYVLILFFIVSIIKGAEYTDEEKINILASIAGAVEFKYRIFESSNLKDNLDIYTPKAKKKVFGPFVNYQQFGLWSYDIKAKILNANIINHKTDKEQGIERLLCYDYSSIIANQGILKQNIEYFDNFIKKFIESLQEKDFNKLVDRSENICQLNELTKCSLYHYISGILFPIPYKEKPLVPKVALYAFTKKINLEFKTEAPIETYKASVDNLFQELSSEIGKNSNKKIENLEKIREEFVNGFIEEWLPHVFLFKYEQEKKTNSLKKTFFERYSAFIGAGLFIGLTSLIFRETLAEKLRALGVRLKIIK